MRTMALRQLCRNFGTSTARFADVAGPSATSGHKDGIKLWRNVFFFVGIPVIGLCMVNAYMGHQEHAHHPRPEFIKYEYLRVRSKRFPWGDGNKSLFHNPHVNALPDGYEE